MAKTTPLSKSFTGDPVPDQVVTFVAVPAMFRPTMPAVQFVPVRPVRFGFAAVFAAVVDAIAAAKVVPDGNS